MTFISLSYFLFLPLVFLVFYLTADRFRWLVLLTASYVFYANLNAPYLLAVLAAVTAVSYACALRMAADGDDCRRKRWFWTGTLACLAILASFKYFPFFASTGSSLGLALPPVIIGIGVSYFSFQAISYLADVYLEIEQPEAHFGYYALYLAYFPKLLQGPIERASHLLPQLKQRYVFDYDAMRSGMLLFTWGVFKKVVVADRLAPIVDTVYNDVHSFTGFPLLLTTYLYALQIYYDFSAYTDMALGSASMFNLRLTPNFNSPYLAVSIADFWRRWHISFSKWILDYIFKPLQLKWRERGTWGTVCALIITFLASGAWHGSSWGYILWGLLHGIYLSAGVLLKPVKTWIHKRLGLQKTTVLKLWQITVTFNLVCFAWIFFRARTFDNAYYVVTHMTDGVCSYLFALATHVNNFAVVSGMIKPLLLGSQKSDYAILVLAIGLICAVEWLKTKGRLSIVPIWLRWPAYYSLVTSILLWGGGAAPDFIYYRF